ncbi:MAG: hypothetical protein GXO83_07275 [Chlorobi bacterium]|nr:hypothetical protein [Chlorobiota bacterium]
MLKNKTNLKIVRPYLFSFFVTLILVLFSCSKTEKFDGYVTTAGTGTDELKIAVVKGTPYEMGHQLGVLLKDDIDSCLSGFLSYAQKEAPEIYSNEQLDMAWETNLPHIDSRVVEEMKGMADGSGIDLKLIQRSHMIPVISSYACSGVAVWGKNTENGHTYQIRNLDFTMGAGLQDHPLVVIYVPDNGSPHANVTFAGYIGSHTGMNANHLVFGEKGQSPMSEYPYNINGVHFSFLFRTLMYDAGSLDDVLNTIRNTTLIKRYFLFFSDGNQETQGGAKVLVSSPDAVKYTIWKDNDPGDIVAPDILPNTIYYTMDNRTAYYLLNQYQGQFDEQKMIEISRAVADKGGNLLDVVYDATALEMWIAYANGSEDASGQQYVHVPMNDYITKAGIKY